MGFLDRLLSAEQSAAPAARPAPVPTTPYVIAGIRLDDGTLSLLSSASLSIQGHDKTYGLGDVMHLNAAEVRVVSKRYVLSEVE